MTPEETAGLLTLGASALGALAHPVLRAAFPQKRITQAAIQPFALTLVSGAVLGWHYIQPGPMAWGVIIPQVALGWVLANSRTAAVAVKKATAKKETA